MVTIGSNREEIFILSRFRDAVLPNAFFVVNGKME
jgi:hypothetical protein